MSDGFPGKPRVLRGAFVEFGLSLPPLFVVFQFNPLQLTRNRSLTFAAPGTTVTATATNQAPAVPPRTLRQFHAGVSDLSELRKQQLVTVQEQTIGFDIRLDATDRLDERDTITEQFGIAPQLSTLELMVHPKEESLLGAALGALLGKPEGFSFTRGENPPMVLFIFGRKRVLPVNINSLNITETEFSTDLNPIRATVAVNLTVIEGKSVPYLYSKAMTEAMSVLNLANVADLADVVVPG
ncbi:hypothetical protein GA0070624_5127 [Micromonospora rhizosphaerae]|uniref:Uncharacterized protein n=1 Tax=Micromonospora rhizosphaerae TaxID=568872 RepID=A0A1C6T016_9ACTN|nr:hypothetical protein [Micromonospora rhizosphaerae]SCL34952.1 hypothetical protein GA0070624_5127 [Micromonospora rhizosphaerae]